MIALWISLKVSALALLLMAITGVPLGLWLARTRSPLRAPIDTLLSLPLVLPPVVSGFVLLWLFAPQGWIGGRLNSIGIQALYRWEMAALASALIAFPLLLRSARVAFESVDPKLESAARNLGLSDNAVLWRVTLPLAQRGILAGMLLGFGRALGEFGATVLVAGNIPGRTQTIPLAIFSLGQRGEFAQVWPYLLVVVVLAFLLVFAADRLVRAGRS